MVAALSLPVPVPRARDVVRLMKPITWFPPMWAFLCGVVSTGTPLSERWPFLLAGMVLAGPLVCGTSQMVNDWYDRHVDAINEPHRPIPSGAIAGRWGLALAVVGSFVSLAVGFAILPLVGWATVLGLVLAWAYSAPPLRLKASGIWGPASVGLCYEGLAWFTGAAAMDGAWPGARVVTVLLLYSAGAHGIMTLNDFKAIKGDRELGIRSLPALLGPRRAAWIACAVMAAAQVAVIVVLARWGMVWSAAAVGIVLAGQAAASRKLLRDPAANAPWYNGVGVTLYVLGMLAAAFGLGAAR